MNNFDSKQMSIDEQPHSSRGGSKFVIESLLYLFPAIAFLLLSTPMVSITTYELLQLLPLSFSREDWDMWRGLYLLMAAYYVGVILIVAIMRLVILTSRNCILKFDKMTWTMLVGSIYCAASIYFYLDWRALLIVGLPTLVLIVRIMVVQSKIRGESGAN